MNLNDIKVSINSNLHHKTSILMIRLVITRPAYNAWNAREQEYHDTVFIELAQFSTAHCDGDD